MSESLISCPICAASIETDKAPCPQCGYDLEEDFWASRQERERKREAARVVWREQHELPKDEAPPVESPHSGGERYRLQDDGTLVDTVTGEHWQRVESMAMIESRYRDLGDGTVIDTVTGLQWMRFALGQTWRDGHVKGEAQGYQWEQALQATKKLNAQGGFGGHKDWRLPSIEELKTLVFRSQKPTICQSAFPNTPADWFWSASPYVYDLGSAWSLYFDNGSDGSNHKAYASPVRLVRSGQ